MSGTIVHIRICDFLFDHALVKYQLPFLVKQHIFQIKEQYKSYHRNNMSDLPSNLKKTSFKSLANALVLLYEQYVHGQDDVLDRHAPLVSRLTKKDSADWLSDSYRYAKSLRHKFERTW